MDSVNGVKVKITKCAHCNRFPSKEEVVAAVEDSKEGWRSKCAVCNGKFKLLEVELYHYKEVGQDRWASRVTSYEPLVELFNNRVGTVSIHISCASRVMPGKTWVDLA